MLHRLAVFVVFLTMFPAAVFAQTEARNALLLGFDVGTRSQQSSDAVELGQLLAELGFEVKTVTNATATTAQFELDKFTEKLKTSGGIGLVFVAGQFVSRNLNPVIVSRTPSESARKRPEITFLPLDSIWDVFNTAAETKGIVILDQVSERNSDIKGDDFRKPFSDAKLRSLGSPKNVSALAVHDLTRGTRCGPSGPVVAAFKKQLWSGQQFDIRELFAGIANNVFAKSDNSARTVFASGGADTFAIVDDTHKSTNKAQSLPNLYREFRAAGKCKCGERQEQLEIGQQILDLYGSNEFNVDVMEYIRRKMADISLNDPLCELRERFDNGYRTKNWAEFFDGGDALLQFETDRAAVLDISVARALVGGEQINVKNDCSRSIAHSNDTTRAIDMIADGQKPRTGKWGIFETISSEAETVAMMHLIRAATADICSRSLASAVPDYEAFLTFRGDNSRRVRIHDRLARFYHRQASPTEFSNPLERALLHATKAYQLEIESLDAMKTLNAKIFLRVVWSDRQTSAGKSVADTEWEKFLESVAKMPRP